MLSKLSAFDSVTATISPVMSTYIQCKGKAWKNAFIASLQKIAGVEYTVYKKKRSWQIKGEWENIKQAHKIFLKVTASEDWLSFSAATGDGYANDGFEKQLPHQSSIHFPHKEISADIKDTEVPQEDKMDLLPHNLGNSGKQNIVEPSDHAAGKDASINGHIVTYNIDRIKNLESQIKKEDTSDSINSASNIKIRDGNIEADSDGTPVEKTNTVPKNVSSTLEQIVHRRKKGRPRKVRKLTSYAEESEAKPPQKKGKKSSKSHEKNTEGDINKMIDGLMSVGDGENESWEDDNNSAEDVSIDGLIKEAKDNINSNKKLHACDLCEFKCKSKTSLSEHKERLHGNQTLKCPICDKTYSVKRDLKKHIRRHTSQFKCEHCGKSYKEERNLKQHFRTHAADYVPPHYPCQMCDKQFTTKYVLNSHIEQIHKGNVPEWLCNVCGRKFKQKHSLQEHHLIHTGERPFSCKICFKTFRHKQSLTSHELLHSNIRHYTCEVCGKEFKHRNSLKIHAVVHNQQRDFECPVCFKKFTQKQALNRHARIHSGEKPFMCELCGDRFNDNSILRRHMLGIHKMELKSGKQHFVLPAEHYANRDKEGVEGNAVQGRECDLCSESFADEAILKQHLIEIHKMECKPKQNEVQMSVEGNDRKLEYLSNAIAAVTTEAQVAGSGLQSGIHLPNYDSENAPSLRGYGTQVAQLFTGYPSGILPHVSGAQFNLPTVSAASIPAALTPALVQFPSLQHSEASTGSDRPDPLTNPNNHYSQFQLPEHSKNPLIPDISQYPRLY